MSYRPEDWLNPYKDKECCWERLCFERGADAMLEALRKQGNQKGGRVRNQEEEIRESGVWVFIPDHE